MDFAKIKKFVVGCGEKFVLIEDGEPAMVVMSFSDYENLARFSHDVKNAPPQAARYEAPTLPSRPEEWQIADAPETELIADDPPPAPLARPRLDEIRLEDLPL